MEPEPQELDPLQTIDVVASPVADQKSETPATSYGDSPAEAKLVAALLAKKPSTTRASVTVEITPERMASRPVIPKAETIPEKTLEAPPMATEAPPDSVLPEPDEIESESSSAAASASSIAGSGSENQPYIDSKAHSLSPGFRYWTADSPEPVSLTFNTLVSAKIPKLKLIPAHKTCKDQVDELMKVIQHKWEVEFVSRHPHGEACVYYLKPEHLQPHDMQALEVLRTHAIAGKICILFVSLIVGIPETMKKLTQLGRMPPHCIFLPWETNISDGTLKALVGFLVSVVGQSMTESRRVCNKVWLPKIRN